MEETKDEQLGNAYNSDAYDSDVLDLEGELSSTDSSDYNYKRSSNKDEDLESIESETDMKLEEKFLDEDEPLESNNQMDVVEENGQRSEENGEDSWTVLGEHRFVEKKILSSAPSWAEKPSTFDNQITSRTGEGIDHIDGLEPQLFENLKSEISIWFPVQLTVLPKLLEDNPSHDIAISAPTGSGKTLCYLIPILNQVLRGWKSKYVLAVVLAPTKTLVHQISEEFKRFNTVGAKVAVLSDTSKYEDERKMLFPNGSTKSRAHVIVSTPERLVLHLIDRNGTINLKRLRYLVVDEADAMRFVREEWLGLLERTANYPPAHDYTTDNTNQEGYNNKLQKILVSATLSLEADKLHDWKLRSPRLYRATVKSVVEKKQDADQNELYNLPVSNAGRLTLPESLTQEHKICDMQFKPLLIYGYLAKNPHWRKVLIFTNKNDTSKRLTILLTYLFENERQVSEISKNVPAKVRAKQLKRMAKAENCVVICSDTVGRGIDVPDIDAVFNYDVPQDARVFLHRAGRTARAGRSGHVITLVTKEEKLGLKRKLIEVDLWDADAENREKHTDFVKRYEKKYKKALSALKAKLEEGKQKRPKRKRKFMQRK